MMEPANQREFDHAPPLRRLHGTRHERVLVKREMSAAGVIVLRYVPTQHSSQMARVHHDDVIEQLPA